MTSAEIEGLRLVSGLRSRLIGKTFHRYSERMLQTDLSVFGASSNS